MKDTQLIDLFQQARNDASLVVIEGIQALKHAIRFEAEMNSIITSDMPHLKKLLNNLAPDTSKAVLAQATEVPETTFQKLSPQPPRTKVIALARRTMYKLSDITKSKPIIFLEDPRDLENIGAVIRVSAAADIAAVVISSSISIWHPAIIRGAAALQYAVPVFNETLENIHDNRSVVCLDPQGELIKTKGISENSIFVFGTERRGISKTMLSHADLIVRLPMKPGVSSLNLATSVAATLYQL